MGDDACEPQRQANGVERAVDALEDQLNTMTANEYLKRLGEILYSYSYGAINITNLRFDNYKKTAEFDLFLGDRRIPVTIDLNLLQYDNGFKEFLREMLRNAL